MRRIFGFGLLLMLAGAALGPAALAQGKKPAASAASSAAPQSTPPADKTAAAKKPPRGPKGAASGQPDTSGKGLAKARYEAGRAAEQAGNFQGAYDEYRAAFAFNADWKIELAW